MTRDGPVPAIRLIGMRWREVEIHRVDLADGYGPGDWPASFVAPLLPSLLDPRADRPAAAGRADGRGRQHRLRPALAGRRGRAGGGRDRALGPGRGGPVGGRPAGTGGRAVLGPGRLADRAAGRGPARAGRAAGAATLELSRSGPRRVGPYVVRRGPDESVGCASMSVRSWAVGVVSTAAWWPAWWWCSPGSPAPRRCRSCRTGRRRPRRGRRDGASRPGRGRRCHRRAPARCMQAPSPARPCVPGSVAPTAPSRTGVRPRTGTSSGKGSSATGPATAPGTTVRRTRHEPRQGLAGLPARARRHGADDSTAATARTDRAAPSGPEVAGGPGAVSCRG